MALTENKLDNSPTADETTLLLAVDNQQQRLSVISEEDDTIEDISDCSLMTSKQDSSNITIRLYKRRWAMLGLFCILAHVNGIQNLQYAAMPKSAVTYFKVTATTFDLLTLAYCIFFAIFAIPCVFIIQVLGLKTSMVICSVYLFLGSSLATTACTKQTLFDVAALSQAVNGIVQVFIMSLATKLAGTWFGPSEVSTATSITVFAYQGGNGLSLIVLPLLVPLSTNMNIVKNKMLIFFGSIEVVGFIAIFLIVIFFQNEPPLPPSISQYETLTMEKSSYGASLKSMLRNRHFVLLIFGFGLNYGMFNALETLVTPQLTSTFPDLSDKIIGQMESVMVLVGVPAPFLFGVWLDRTKSYLKTSLVVYLMCCIGCACYIAALVYSLNWAVWVSLSFLGFFLSAYMSIGMEIAAELTYPEPESIASGLIYASGYAFSAIEIRVMRLILNNSSVLMSNIFLIIVIVLGFLLTILIRGRMNRLQSNEGNAENEGVSS